ncbi:hypothetical protein E2C01_007818 [Portunus trituberculatus]|uniref:Uncharacterized protein n=1 Tax=Portunus trituberculatus TaxID=210409 RepID=A0A5B7D140_PORTR|nr:hypothetical protein [Portunus trituberculatus]
MGTPALPHSAPGCRKRFPVCAAIPQMQKPTGSTVRDDMPSCTLLASMPLTTTVTKLPWCSTRRKGVKCILVGPKYPLSCTDSVSWMPMWSVLWRRWRWADRVCSSSSSQYTGNSAEPRDHAQEDHDPSSRDGSVGESK